MAYRTATYNGVSLGTNMIPLETNILDYQLAAEWGIQITPLFQRNEAITRYAGPRLSIVKLRFCLDVQQDITLDTDQDRKERLNSLIEDCTPTVGSMNGGSLVITDGVKSLTWSNAMIKSMKDIYSIQGLTYVDAEFWCRKTA